MATSNLQINNKTNDKGHKNPYERVMLIMSSRLTK